MNHLSFATLLYRYFFFQWLFRDPGGGRDGTLFERAAIRRHNERMAAWLPTYMRRWMACAVLLYLAASVASELAGWPGLARGCHAASAMCIAFAVTIATTWVGLRHQAQEF